VIGTQMNSKSTMGWSKDLSIFLCEAAVDRPADSRMKIVLLGDTRSGKTSFVDRFCLNRFRPELETTCGAVFASRSVYYRKKIRKLEIWDTAGNSKFQSLAPLYYRGADALVALYDMTDPVSFDRATQWADELQQGTEKVEILLAGNKLDLILDDDKDMDVEDRFAKKDRIEQSSEIRGKLADYLIEHPRVMALEVSCKRGYNVAAAIYWLVRSSIDNQSRRHENERTYSMPLAEEDSLDSPLHNRSPAASPSGSPRGVSDRCLVQ